MIAELLQNFAEKDDLTICQGLIGAYLCPVDLDNKLNRATFVFGM